jgi:hypothetical protein
MAYSLIRFGLHGMRKAPSFTADRTGTTPPLSAQGVERAKPGPVAPDHEELSHEHQKIFPCQIQGKRNRQDSRAPVPGQCGKSEHERHVSGHRRTALHGEAAEITIQLTGSEPEIAVNLSGRACRLTEDGIGFTFEKIELDSYTHLKNIISYNMKDSEKVMEEIYHAMDEKLAHQK